MKRYVYTDIVKKIYSMFNSSFQTDYKIIYQSRENAETLNTEIKELSKTAGGYYHYTSKSIYIFSNIINAINQKNYNNPINQNDNGLAFLIYACFHELEHRLQFECPQKLRKQTSFSSVMYNVEKIIHLFDRDHYKQNHDNYYLEIDADTKGVENAINFIDFYEIEGINEEYYKALMTYNKYRQVNYDIPQFIRRLNNIVKANPQILKDKRYISDEQILSFYNEDGKIQSIGEIMKSPNVLTPYIVSSEMFLKSIDWSSITQEQRKFIMKYINFVTSEHKSKKVVLKQMYPDAKVAMEKINNYTHVVETPSRRTVEFMADENYYQFLENNVKTLSKIALEDDEQEL